MCQAFLKACMELSHEGGARTKKVENHRVEKKNTGDGALEKCLNRSKILTVYRKEEKWKILL